MYKSVKPYYINYYSEMTYKGYIIGLINLKMVLHYKNLPYCFFR